MGESEKDSGEKDSGEKDSASQTNHWWEYYFVRYFVGTVVGCGVVLFLSQGPFGSFLKPISSMQDARGSIGLLGLGLAYCYIASAPMLVLHSTRGQFLSTSIGRRTLAVILIMFVISVCAYWYFYHCLACSALGQAAPWILFGVTTIQVALIAEAQSDCFALSKKFYSNLSKARSKKGHIPNYVESYRHLREHANACAIIVLEILLAFALASISSVEGLMLALLVWTLPGGYCWFIATALEQSLADPSETAHRHH
ncbi:MAG TPA: hypothetical protein VKZ53_13175 [Candidatus Angelobacter sp.]|nr:hypothetical protein [Candidatus Angelobacter sp.]